MVPEFSFMIHLIDAEIETRRQLHSNLRTTTSGIPFELNLLLDHLAILEVKRVLVGHEFVQQSTYELHTTLNMSCDVNGVHVLHGHVRTQWIALHLALILGFHCRHDQTRSIVLHKRRKSALVSAMDMALNPTYQSL